MPPAVHELLRAPTTPGAAHLRRNGLQYRSFGLRLRRATSQAETGEQNHHGQHLHGGSPVVRLMSHIGIGLAQQGTGRSLRIAVMRDRRAARESSSGRASSLTLLVKAIEFADRTFPALNSAGSLMIVVRFHYPAERSRVSSAALCVTANCWCAMRSAPVGIEVAEPGSPLSSDPILHRINEK